MKLTKGGAPIGNTNHLKHSKCGTRVYYCWRNMLNRCQRKNVKSFKDYGAKGIKVLWPSFEAFYADMGDPPLGMTIERINNNGHYCKENCHWATRFEQGQNRSHPRLLTLNGKTQTISQWSRDTGIKLTTIHMRLCYGWSIEEALSV
jgi:hypothetical protein